MKALPILVYKNSALTGCSNNGVTEKHDQLLLIHDKGFIEVDESNLPENLVKLVTRQLFDGEYKHIEPYAAPKGIGYMSGGAWAYSSDSRFNEISKYPLSIHDRVE